jgi:hypothetical protein
VPAGVSVPGEFHDGSELCREIHKWCRGGSPNRGMRSVVAALRVFLWGALPV